MRCTVTPTIHNNHDATQPHTQKMHGRIQLSRSQEKINHLMYMDDIKLLKNNWKLLYTQLEYTVKT